MTCMLWQGWSGLVPQSLPFQQRWSWFSALLDWWCCPALPIWSATGGTCRRRSSALSSSFGDFSTGWQKYQCLFFTSVTTGVADVTSGCVFQTRLLPESARWLLTQGRKEEAKKELQRAARVNGRKLPEDLFEKVSMVGGISFQNPPHLSFCLYFCVLYR